VHFDHVGGNHQFTENCLGICMGGRDPTFSSNLDINSLCLAHNCRVRHFTVSRWLQDGDLIYLDDANKSRELSLEVLHTPGHTSDSIALYSRRDHRLFIGDTLCAPPLRVAPCSPPFIRGRSVHGHPPRLYWQ
jgi:glyoxylase-like metal-dependent hydrolase (beta-lactamase superfamily II)